MWVVEKLVMIDEMELHPLVVTQTLQIDLISKSERILHTERQNTLVRTELA